MRRAAAALSLLALAACLPVPVQEGVTYRPPVPAPAAEAVAVPAGHRDAALHRVADNLRTAGFRVVAANPRTGVVLARGAVPGMVDCGTFTQLAHGNVARFPAHAPRAALFDPAEPGRILLRRVRTQTEVTVEIPAAEPFAARIRARHEVRVSQGPAGGGGKARREVQRFAEGASATFADNVTCAGTGGIARVVAGG